MFFRWPWDGAATLLGPSGRPLATSPAVQGAARDYGGGGALGSTRAKGLPARGTRRQPAPRPPRPVHGPRRPLAPAHSTSHDARSFAPKRTPLAAARWERARGAAGHRFRHTTLGSGSTGRGSECARRPTTTATAGPHYEHDGAPKTAASSAGSAAETGTASSGARGGHRRPVYGERRKAARWRKRPHRATTAHSSGGSDRTGAASSSAAT